MLTLLIGIVIVAAVAILLNTVLCSGGKGSEPSPTLSPVSAATPSPTLAPTPSPSPAPSPSVSPSALPSEPVQTAAEAYDFSAFAPETEPVEDDYFADAVFIGDSRTDGFRLYSGLKNTHFLSYKGVTVFDVENREKKVVEVDGKKVSFLEALAAGDYAKVYIMLGVNELGYPGTDSFEESYGHLIDHVRELQPDAIIYVQSMVPVNPERCKEYKQPYYVTNEKVQAFTDVLVPLAEEKRVVYVNVAEALVDENGILPADMTHDGVHFAKEGYVKWLEYLKCHTVDPDAYWAGQESPEEGDDVT